MDSFWERHSIKKERINSTSPAYLLEETLAQNLEPSIELLCKAFGGNHLSKRDNELLTCGLARANSFSFAEAFQMMNYLFEKNRQLLLAHKSPSPSASS